MKQWTHSVRDWTQAHRRRAELVVQVKLTIFKTESPAVVCGVWVPRFSASLESSSGKVRRIQLLSGWTCCRTLEAPMGDARRG